MIGVGKRVAVLQSNYIPWRGYFDLIAYVDQFVLLDSVQYTRRDWRNRNKIKTPRGVEWLTVPVRVKGKYDQRICDTRIDGSRWVKRHLGAFTESYCKSPFFEDSFTLLRDVLLSEHEFLSALNRDLIERLALELGIRTPISDSGDLFLSLEKSERLASIVESVGGEVYVSGPAAKAYLEVDPFDMRGIKVEWFDYEGYVPYPQMGPGFEPLVSIVDLLMNVGPSARQFLRY